jgi:CRP-like cAMP-binding protein
VSDTRNQVIDVPEFLRKHVLDGTGLSEGDVNLAASFFTVRHLDKGSRLLAPGEPCTFGGLVIRGCLRVYFSESDGCERVLYFAPEHWWVTDIESLLLEQPTTLGIDAVESTDLLVIDKSSRALLRSRVPVCDRIFGALTENALLTLQRRLVGSMRRTAAQRYHEFRTLYPGLALRIPQYHIAAYLGISPEFLSKLRKRLLRTEEYQSAV